MSSSCPVPASSATTTLHTESMGIFARFLSVWVALAMLVGAVIGKFATSVADGIDELTVSNINLPIAALVWLMVYPMALDVDLESIKAMRSHPRGLFITTGVNWAIQPFLMWGLAVLFYTVFFASELTSTEQDEYVAGAVILGGSPCTAMVFVWSKLAGGNAGFTLLQVAVNDLVLLFLYAPTLILILNTSDIDVPYDTVFLSVVLFVVVPFGAGAITKHYASPATIERIKTAFKPVTIVALLLTLVLIAVLNGEKIWDHPLDLLIIMPPLILQNVIAFILAFGSAYYLEVPFTVAAPAGFIASSNFFELAVGVAIALYGVDSGATLVTIVGVLVEVPVMLSLVWAALKFKPYFELQTIADANRKHAATVTPDSNVELQDVPV